MSQMITPISNGFFITGIYMRRLNSLITLVLILLACQFACAETIFETFGTDPLTRGWIMENPAGSVFTYNPLGYIEATIARNPTLKDRYMEALSQIYYMPKSDMNSTVSDIWLELDVLYIDGDERTQGQIGVMKSDSVQGIGGNGIVIDIIKDLVTPGTGPYRIDEHMYFTGGTGFRYCTGTPGGSFTKVPNRVKTHIYYDPNDHWVKVMELKVYEIAPDGSLTLVSELTAPWNGISAGGGESCQVDAFGIFNLSGAVTPTPQSFYIDNIYFSTDGPNASSPPPSFVRLLIIGDVTARTTTSSIQIDTLVQNVTSQAVSCKIRNRLYEDEDTNRPAFLDVTSIVTSIPGDTNTTITSSNTGLSPALWTPDNPTCYLLITDLIDSNTDGLLERREAAIGFRTFTVNGNHFELNGRTIYLRGYAQMPPGRIPGTMTSDPAFINQHIDRLKQNNINIVRMAGPATDNEAWITACGRLGMMVMAGCYSGSGSTDPNLSYNLSVLQGEIAKFKNCPSVVAWITANEYAGPSSSLQSLYDAAKALDPTRLVFAAASSGTASDFIDRHNYLGWYCGSSVYSLYSIAYTDSLPVTYTECVGAYTNLQENDGSFQVNADKLIDSALRAIGHSYSFAADSLWYQAYLTREWIEIVRRARGSSSSIAGLLPFTNGYSYNYQTKTETPKPLFTEIQKAYKTIHVSIECQCPHVFAGSTLSAQLYVLNDDPNGTQLPASTLYVDLLNSAGTSIYNTSYALSAINYYGTAVQPVTFVVPSSAATGTYSLRARLVTSTELDSSESGICVAQSGWTQVKNKTVPAVALYDPAGSTVSVLQSLGAPVQVISNFSNLSSYQWLIIGVNGFDSSVAAAESTIQSFIAAGKKVLILEQNNSTVASSFNSSSWLGTAITLEQGGDDFVNIERPQISTLMSGLSRSDFRIWNNIGTTSLPDRSLMAYYLKLTGDDLNTTAVLANAGQHLSRAALVEIFPSGPASGSCILSQLRINSSDPLSMKFAANLFDYLTESVQHNQYIEVGPVMRFGKFKTEKGAICASLLQGMFISASGEYYQIDGYAFRGPMYTNSMGYLYEADGGATRSICPMYVKFHFALGNTIVVDVNNPTASGLQFRLKINGVASAWTQVSPLERKLASIVVSPVAANTNIKLEIESDEGLIFYSMKFAEPDLCDVDEDGYVNFVDFATAFQNWMESSI